MKFKIILGVVLGILLTIIYGYFFIDGIAEKKAPGPNLDLTVLNSVGLIFKNYFIAFLSLTALSISLVFLFLKKK